MLHKASLIQRLTKSGIARPEQIVPCSDDDIARIQRASNVQYLPKAYIDFLKTAGRRAGRFLLDVDVFFDKMIGLNNVAQDVLCDWKSALVLPEGAFVFANRRREQFLFFINDGKSDDPAIFFYFEGRPRFEKITPSIWTWLENELRAEEQLREEFPNNPLWKS